MLARFQLGREQEKGDKKMLLKKRFITLVEMMIVMFLIAMITGVIAYNYTGSLDEGKAFKTKSGIEKIHTILDLYYASHPDERDEVESRWKGILASSPLVKNASELEKDGWGVDYKVTIEGDNIVIVSERYQEYLNKHNRGTMFGKEKQ